MTLKIISTQYGINKNSYNVHKLVNASFSKIDTLYILLYPIQATMQQKDY